MYLGDCYTINLIKSVTVVYLIGDICNYAVDKLHVQYE